MTAVKGADVERRESASPLYTSDAYIAISSILGRC